VEATLKNNKYNNTTPTTATAPRNQRKTFLQPLCTLAPLARKNSPNVYLQITSLLSSLRLRSVAPLPALRLINKHKTEVTREKHVFKSKQAINQAQTA